MKTLITGTTTGIGRATALKFLENGHEVIGVARGKSTIEHPLYTHIMKDVRDIDLPEINNVEILINNAGTQDREVAIDVNLKSAISYTEKYAFHPDIKSIVFVASASARTGAEFPEYVASKGGLVAYMKNVANRVAKYGATCNSISPGGVITELNKHIIDDQYLWKQVLDETLFHKWATVEEIAEYIYFVSVVNKSMTAQDILIDNGEEAKAIFIW